MKTVGLVSPPLAPAQKVFFLLGSPFRAPLGWHSVRAGAQLCPVSWEPPLCKRWERPDCSSHTRCTLTHTPNASQLDRAVCKTQHQPNEKHIASQKKLGGQKRAAQRLGTLDRASEPT